MAVKFSSSLMQAIYANLSQLFGIAGATYTSYSPTPYNLGNLTKSFVVTPSTLASARANLALGR